MRKREFKTCYENRIFETKNFGDVIVTKYIDSYNVHVKFLDTGGVFQKFDNGYKLSVVKLSDYC